MSLGLGIEDHDVLHPAFLGDREAEEHPALDAAVLRLRAGSPGSIRTCGTGPRSEPPAIAIDGAPPPWRIPPSPEPKSTPAGARLLESRPAATLALVFVETFWGLGGGSIFLISGLTRAISWVSRVPDQAR